MTATSGGTPWEKWLRSGRPVEGIRWIFISDPVELRRAQNADYFFWRGYRVAEIVVSHKIIPVIVDPILFFRNLSTSIRCSASECTDSINGPLRQLAERMFIHQWAQAGFPFGVVKEVYYSRSNEICRFKQQSRSHGVLWKSRGEFDYVVRRMSGSAEIRVSYRADESEARRTKSSGNARQADGKAVVAGSHPRSIELDRDQDVPYTDSYIARRDNVEGCITDTHRTPLE